MRTRSFGKLNWQVSALGFGAMRLPLIKPGKEDLVDKLKAIQMIRHAIDQGVNYIDTAYPYHDEQSESIVGQALKEGYRDQVKVATKLPCWLLEKPEDFDKYLDIQLERLGIDQIDFYLFHAIWKDRWDRIKSLKMLDSAERAMADGRIRYLGFSFHDQYPLFKEIVDDYDNWTLAQIQYNFLNETVQAGTAGLKYATEKGLAVVVMEPLLGGSIANPSGKLKDVWKKAGKKPADVALRWLWDKPEVSVVLSGMSTMEQVDQNIQSACHSGIHSFSKEEHTLIEQVKGVYDQLPFIPCTNCKYCMPCPHGVDIPYNFELYNESLINQDLGKALYSWHFKESEKASNCQQCGICETQCPQKILIMKHLQTVSHQFE
ncbi:aldo/keto reductase [bacterium]